MPLPVYVDFTDGNRSWRESGDLTRYTSDKGAQTIWGWLLTNDKGTRVFPMGGRGAEVYDMSPGAGDEMALHTSDMNVLVDNTPEVF
jgi:hypothetical protein